MKHVKQNKNECILASIAVLTGTPYKAVQRYANLVAQNPWVAIHSEIVATLFEERRNEAYQTK